MPNTADIVLNQRLDELAALERTLANCAGDRLAEFGDVETAWYLGLQADAQRRRDVCRRGLMRCCPLKGAQAIDEMLHAALWINR